MHDTFCQEDEINTVLLLSYCKTLPTLRFPTLGKEKPRTICSIKELLPSGVCYKNQTGKSTLNFDEIFN